MEPINNLIGPIDGFHFKHGGNEFSVHKVLCICMRLTSGKMLVKKPTTRSRPISLGTRGPSNVMSGAKGTFVKKVALSTTMGPGVRIDPAGAIAASAAQ